ncbi:succinyl-diaminopimelate desuccinylase [Halovulum sp. GXIMD14793]
MTDPVDLTARLIRCPSVTPDEGGALILLQEMLTDAGFKCTWIERGGVSNLFAKWGEAGNGKVFGFNGHTDVVPTGPVEDWTSDPFTPEIRNGRMYGRGAVDMKSGVAAFVAAAIDFVTETPPDGAVVVTVTGDEEGTSTDGTIAILDWMAENGERMDVCIVGEPTCVETMGDMIKIGRRGALTLYLTTTGKQGHAAYPHRANNPVHALVRLLDRLASAELDQGTEHFDPSTLAVTTVDVGNPASNVIPAAAKATLNIRFNDTHSGQSLIEWAQTQADIVAKDTGVHFALTHHLSGEAFLTPPGPLSDLVSTAIQSELGTTPTLSTTGGTSDARFIKSHCPVVEVGLVGKTMHQVDEYVEVEEIGALKRVYGRLLRDFFARSAR